MQFLQVFALHLCFHCFLSTHHLISLLFSKDPFKTTLKSVRVLNSCKIQIISCLPNMNVPKLLGSCPKKKEKKGGLSFFFNSRHDRKRLIMIINLKETNSPLKELLPSRLASSFVYNANYGSLYSL